MNIYNKPFNGKDFEKYYVDSINEYLAEREKFKGNNLKYLIKYDRSDLASDEYIDIFLAATKDLMLHTLKPSDIVIGFENNYNKKTFSEKELEHLKKLDEMSKKLGVQVGIFDFKDVFDYNSVANADRIIKENANEIKKHNYSPIEKLLHAYLIVSRFRKYTLEDKTTESDSISRSVYGILNSDKIVCVGYSEYLKAIIYELGDENLKVFANSIGMIRYINGAQDYGFHRNNISYLKDDKYKVEGFYYLDPTWDSLHEYSLNYFLTEISQIKNISAEVHDRSDILSLRNAQLRNILQNRKKYKRPKIRKNNISYLIDKTFTSVSRSQVDLLNEFVNAGKPTEFSENLLTHFLTSKQDFKDFVILKETMKEMNDTGISFDESVEKNAKLVDEDIIKTNTFINKKDIFEYLQSNSPHVDVGVIQNALQNVLSSMHPNASKEKISKLVYNILKNNIKNSKRIYYGDETMFSECEELQ